MKTLMNPLIESDHTQSNIISECNPQEGWYANLFEDKHDVYREIIDVYDHKDGNGAMVIMTNDNSYSQETHQAYRFFWDVRKVCKTLPENARIIIERHRIRCAKFNNL